MAIDSTSEEISSSNTSGHIIAAAKVKPFEVEFAKLMACLTSVYLVCGIPFDVSA
ncbi:hypothetical protein DPMN_180901 [Dreissena polymorpha]|uniref:Uncharacterized protein n=1 Tax=Dreissena polymorpha TaxID=45954 RepID=A0A9D4DCH8_DREPO|nr:hypothetical protein DPMN_180901 [Dreissena polymorpha]